MGILLFLVGCIWLDIVSLDHFFIIYSCGEVLIAARFGAVNELVDIPFIPLGILYVCYDRMLTNLLGACFPKALWCIGTIMIPLVVCHLSCMFIFDPGFAIIIEVVRL